MRQDVLFCSSNKDDLNCDDSSGYSHTTGSTSTTSSGLDCLEFTKQDELKLREYISKLKLGRSSVQSTVMELESFHKGEDNISTLSTHSSNKGKVPMAADLEMAVCVQELMCSKEEIAVMRAKIYMLEKDKSQVELHLAQNRETESILRAHLDHLKDEVVKDKSSAT